MPQSNLKFRSGMCSIYVHFNIVDVLVGVRGEWQSASERLQL